MELQTYWGQKGKYQSEYERLVELMPQAGNCSTVAGELIRAATRLNYDFYNNGMGNNTSGAINFLQAHDVVDLSTYQTVYEYSRGKYYEGNYGEDSLHKAIVACMDQTIEFIMKHPELETEPNEECIFDYDDEDEHFCDNCGCTMGDRDYGWLCEDCHDDDY